MDEEEMYNSLTIEEPYKTKLISGLKTDLEFAFDDDADEKSFICILNHSKCAEIAKKSKLEDVIHFPLFVFMQIGNYSKEPSKLLEENITEESFRNYLA